MKIAKVKQGDRFVYATSYAAKKNGIELFIRGEGWKKTKRFTEVEFDPINNGSMLDFAVLARQFGDEVAIDLTFISPYAHSFILTATTLFAAMEETDTFDLLASELLMMLRFDPRLAVLGYASLDIVGLDMALGVPDGVSTQEFIQEKYSDSAVKLVTRLLG